jgi:hypothetical protein
MIDSFIGVSHFSLPHKYDNTTLKFHRNTSTTINSPPAFSYCPSLYFATVKLYH